LLENEILGGADQALRSSRLIGEVSFHQIDWILAEVRRANHLHILELIELIVQLDLGPKLGRFPAFQDIGQIIVRSQAGFENGLRSEHMVERYMYRLIVLLQIVKFDAVVTV